MDRDVMRLQDPDDTDPAPDEPVVETTIQGDPAIYWLTRRHAAPEDCDYCKAGRCVQKVLRSAEWDSDVIVHNDPGREFQ